jgi:hypothetical protein
MDELLQVLDRWWRTDEIAYSAFRLISGGIPPEIALAEMVQALFELKVSLTQELARLREEGTPPIVIELTPEQLHDLKQVIPPLDDVKKYSNLTEAGIFVDAEKPLVATATPPQQYNLEVKWTVDFTKEDK